MATAAAAAPPASVPAPMMLLAKHPSLHGVYATTNAEHVNVYRVEKGLWPPRPHSTRLAYPGDNPGRGPSPSDTARPPTRPPGSGLPRKWGPPLRPWASFAFAEGPVPSARAGGSPGQVGDGGSVEDPGGTANYYSVLPVGAGHRNAPLSLSMSCSETPLLVFVSDSVGGGWLASSHDPQLANTASVSLDGRRVGTLSAIIQAPVSLSSGVPLASPQALAVPAGDVPVRPSGHHRHHERSTASRVFSEAITASGWDPLNASVIAIGREDGVVRLLDINYTAGGGGSLAAGAGPSGHSTASHGSSSVVLGVHNHYYHHHHNHAVAADAGMPFQAQLPLSSAWQQLSVIQERVLHGSISALDWVPQTHMSVVAAKCCDGVAYYAEVLDLRAPDGGVSYLGTPPHRDFTATSRSSTSSTAAPAADGSAVRNCPVWPTTNRVLCYAEHLTCDASQRYVASVGRQRDRDILQLWDLRSTSRPVSQEVFRRADYTSLVWRDGGSDASVFATTRDGQLRCHSFSGLGVTRRSLTRAGTATGSGILVTGGGGVGSGGVGSGGASGGGGTAVTAGGSATSTAAGGGGLAANGGGGPAGMQLGRGDSGSLGLSSALPSATGDPGPGGLWTGDHSRESSASGTEAGTEDLVDVQSRYSALSADSRTDGGGGGGETRRRTVTVHVKPTSAEKYRVYAKVPAARAAWLPSVGADSWWRGAVDESTPAVEDGEQTHLDGLLLLNSRNGELYYQVFSKHGCTTAVSGGGTTFFATGPNVYTADTTSEAALLNRTGEPPTSSGCGAWAPSVAPSRSDWDNLLAMPPPPLWRMEGMVARAEDGFGAHAKPNLRILARRGDDREAYVVFRYAFLASEYLYADRAHLPSTATLPGVTSLLAWEVARQHQLRQTLPGVAESALDASELLSLRSLLLRAMAWEWDSAVDEAFHADAPAVVAPPPPRGPNAAAARAPTPSPEELGATAPAMTTADAIGIGTLREALERRVAIFIFTCKLQDAARLLGASDAVSDVYPALAMLLTTLAAAAESDCLPRAPSHSRVDPSPGRTGEARGGSSSAGLSRAGAPFEWRQHHRNPHQLLPPRPALDPDLERRLDDALTHNMLSLLDNLTPWLQVALRLLHEQQHRRRQRHQQRQKHQQSQSRHRHQAPSGPVNTYAAAELAGRVVPGSDALGVSVAWSLTANQAFFVEALRMHPTISVADRLALAVALLLPGPDVVRAASLQETCPPVAVDQLVLEPLQALQSLCGGILERSVGSLFCVVLTGLGRPGDGGTTALLAAPTLPTETATWCASLSTTAFALGRVPVGGRSGEAPEGADDTGDDWGMRTSLQMYIDVWGDVQLPVCLAAMCGPSHSRLWKTWNDAYRGWLNDCGMYIARGRYDISCLKNYRGRDAAAEAVRSVPSFPPCVDLASGMPLPARLRSGFTASAAVSSATPCVCTSGATGGGGGGGSGGSSGCGLGAANACSLTATAHGMMPKRPISLTFSEAFDSGGAPATVSPYVQRAMDPKRSVELRCGCGQAMHTTAPSRKGTTAPMHTGTTSSQRRQLMPCQNPECRRVDTPICTVCSERMESRLTDLPPDMWFVWCTSCLHGGHLKHWRDWFNKHTKCPVEDCSCFCRP